MSEDTNFAETVSREELGALLDSARAERGIGSGAIRTTGLLESVGSELVEVAKRFAVEQGRSLSTLNQTSIHFTFSHWEEINLRQFAAAMLKTDRVARVDLGNGREPAYFLLSRPLIFGWMMLAFGARPGAPLEPLPLRAYTRIEERMIQRAAEKLSTVFAEALSGQQDVDTKVLAIEDPALLYARSKQALRLLSFDVDGFGEDGVLRVALPVSLLGDSPLESLQDNLATTPDELAGQLFETPIELHVELGFAEVSLSNLARLAVGDELKLERADDGGLIVNVEDSPRYRAETGKIGERLAVRITEVMSS